MKKIITLFAFVLTALCSSAQEWWSAVKVFDFDPKDDVYNMYIDSVGSSNGSAVFCFQTDSTKKLIKTDFKGAVISETVNPYRYFSVQNGDTLISIKGGVMNLTTGDTIFNLPTDFICLNITSSSTGIYTLVHSFVWRVKDVIRNCSNSEGIFTTYYYVGLGSSDRYVYMIERNNNQYLLYYFDENTRNKYQAYIPIPGSGLCGIAGYKGSHYVYSNADKAVYRVGPPKQEQYYTDSSIEYLYEIPSKLFIKKRTDVSQDYLLSLLDSKTGGEYQIGWIGDDMCKVITDGNIVNDVIDGLLQDDAIMVASHVYVFKSDYEHYIMNNRPESMEVCPLNDVVYWRDGKYDASLIDSLANVYNLTVSPSSYIPEYMGTFNASKTSDIFELSRKLYETGYFHYAYPNLFQSVVKTYTEVNQEHVDEINKVYYNLSGRRIDSPSGLTIVVTRYSDGSVRTEKKLFR